MKSNWNRYPGSGLSPISEKILKPLYLRRNSKRDQPIIFLIRSEIYKFQAKCKSFDCYRFNWIVKKGVQYRWKQDLPNWLFDGWFICTEFVEPKSGYFRSSDFYCRGSWFFIDKCPEIKTHLAYSWRKR